MAIFKCKMCGDTLEFNAGATVCTCESCGTKQTLPRLDGDRKANLYDRANHFRRNNDFDKAMGIYEQILNEDNTDAEAYWSLVLCRYGIEYVEDPSSHKRVPTVNRAQYTSIYADENYKSALEHADAVQREVYENEAKAIDEIQKGILEISQKEEPFDIFICYKETDNNGRRTPDSVLAQDLYHQLTQEGFKVFFSRITLEDKLGTAYEPYIFAALNSAKVMVAIGTKPEYFNAVWVKNEWSRYLALIKNGAKKMLIPAYRDMDPYDLPEEFSHLQAQDMSKLGFMQDLIRGIKKITKADEPKKETVKETVVVNNTSASGVNVESLLKRAFMFLEDGDWKSADEYCEKVLDIDPENARAYLGKLMADDYIEANKIEDLKDCSESFDENLNYQKIMRFGDEKLKTQLNGYIKFINDRNENERLEELYSDAIRAMNKADSESLYKNAAKQFEEIIGFKDSDKKVEACLKKAEECFRIAEENRKNEIYNEAAELAKKGSISSCESAIQKWEFIPGWRDSAKQIIDCQKKIAELKAKAEADRIWAEKEAEARRKAKEIAAKKRKKLTAIIAAVIVVIAAAAVSFVTVIKPSMTYNRAVKFEQNGDIVAAYDIFKSLGSYSDSAEKVKIIGNSDAYRDARMKVADVGNEIIFGLYEQDNDPSNGKESIEWIVLDKKDKALLVISKYALDSQPYNIVKKSITWEDSSIRLWLNDSFINNAFSDAEKIMIAETNVIADVNPGYSTNPGNATKDMVFLLSITEAEKCFNSDVERQCKPTAYAVANGAYVNNDNGNCMWWLRSLGLGQDCAAHVYDGGVVDYYGYDVNLATFCIRPALWINLES